MAQNDILKRYLDAGIAFTQLTRARAEDIVKELVKAGEVQRDQVQAQVDELIDRSRRNTEQLVSMVRQEVAAQFSQLGLATKADIEALEHRLTAKFGGSTTKAGASAPAPANTTRPRKATAKTAPAAKRATGTTKKAAKKAPPSSGS